MPKGLHIGYRVGQHLPEAERRWPTLAGLRGHLLQGLAQRLGMGAARMECRYRLLDGG